MTLETNSKSATQKLKEKVDSLPEGKDFLHQMARYVTDESPEFSYLCRIEKYPRLSQTELSKMLSSLSSSDADEKRIRKKLSESHLALVVWIAKDYYREDVPFLDLINEGTVAMVGAVNKFNPEIDSDFSEHIVATTQRAISQFVKEETNSKQLPQALIEKISSIKPVARKLAEQLGREPTRAEIAKAMKTTEDDLDRLINLAKAKEEAGDSEEGEADADSDSDAEVEFDQQDESEEYFESDYDGSFEEDED